MDQTPEVIYAADKVTRLTHSLPVITGCNFRIALNQILDLPGTTVDQVQGVKEEIESWIQKNREGLANVIFLEDLDELEDEGTLQLSAWRDGNTAIDRAINFPSAGLSFDLKNLQVKKIQGGTHFLFTLESGVEIKVPREYIPALGISYETKKKLIRD